ANEINSKICSQSQDRCYIAEDAENAMDSVRCYLESSNLKWILVYDNWQEVSKADKPLPQPNSKMNQQVMLISQQRTLQGHHIELLPFSDQESVDLLTTYFHKTPKTELQLLAKSLNNYPIAISTVGKYLQEHDHITIGDWLAKNADAIESVNGNLNKFFNAR